MTKDEAVTQVLTTALDAAKKTGAWLSDQVPDVLHQLIVWHIAQDIFLLSIAAVMVTVYVSSLSWFDSEYEAGRKKHAERGKNPQWYSIEDMPLGAVWLMWLLAGGAATVIGLISLVINGLDLIELLVAPKVWLLEYAAHLVK